MDIVSGVSTYLVLYTLGQGHADVKHEYPREVNSAALVFERSLVRYAVLYRASTCIAGAIHPCPLKWPTIDHLLGRYGCIRCFLYKIFASRTFMLSECPIANKTPC